MGWTFRNWTARGPEIPVRSPDHALELLAEQAGRDRYGIVLEFVHANRGLISCVARVDVSTLAFHPGYNPAAHSLAGVRNALRVQPVIVEPFDFVDSTGVASAIPAQFVLTRSKVDRGLRYILEHHDFPGFIRWSEGAAEE